MEARRSAIFLLPVILESGKLSRTGKNVSSITLTKMVSLLRRFVQAQIENVARSSLYHKNKNAVVPLWQRCAGGRHKYPGTT